MNKLMPTVGILIVILAISCSSSKKTVYFMNQGNAEMIASNIGPSQVIEVGDLLSITMTSKSTKASGTPINSTTTGYSAASYTGAGSQVGGYLVGADGYIKYPELGKVKAVDLTATELEEKITTALLSGKL
jgi:polysaccharide biosynthesis/export protein